MCWKPLWLRLKKRRDFTLRKPSWSCGDGYDANAELVRELQDFVKQRITPYKYPRRIEFLTRVAEDSCGKSNAL